MVVPLQRRGAVSSMTSVCRLCSIVVKNNYSVVDQYFLEVVVPTTRTYGDACGIARALDVVGERWALLVVRELLFGPQRFADLRRGIPGASSNLVSDRLRELERHQVVRRRKLPPPAASSVYELTEQGRQLEPVVLALGNWGSQLPLPSAPVTLGAVSMLVYLRSAARVDPSAPVSRYRLQLDDRVWTVRTDSGVLHIEPGDPVDPDAGLRSDPRTFNALLANPRTLTSAVAAGTVETTGDPAAIRRLLRAVTPATSRTR
jgi:DNA-binding HxlR family transcriptional regulator